MVLEIILVFIENKRVEDERFDLNPISEEASNAYQDSERKPMLQPSMFKAFLKNIIFLLLLNLRNS